MPFLTDDLIVRRLNAEQWVLVKPLPYQGERDLFTVPAGFVTDFASVPLVATWLVPRFGVFTAAVILHDWLCGPAVREGLISPVDADGIFRRVLRELGTPTVQRWLMWAGVRWSAITQAHRRPGWWSTASTLLGVSLAALPLVVPTGLAVAFGLTLYGAAERAARVLFDPRAGLRVPKSVKPMKLKVTE